MSTSHRTVVTLLLIASFFTQETFAQSNRDPLGVQRDQHAIGSTSEFVYRNDAEEILVPVYVLGAVARPGLYHIPVKTDFVTLMAITGGPTKDALIDEIQIKKQQSKDVVTVNLEKLIANKDMKNPVLANNDVVLLKVKEPIISPDTFLLLSVVSSVLTLGVAALALSTKK